MKKVKAEARFSVSALPSFGVVLSWTELKLYKGLGSGSGKCPWV